MRDARAKGDSLLEVFLSRQHVTSSTVYHNDNSGAGEELIG